MSILEETILDKIRQLAPDQQQQVLAFVQSLQPAEFDYVAWWQKTRAIREEVGKETKEQWSVQDLLDELRDEASDLH